MSLNFKPLGMCLALTTCLLYSDLANADTSSTDAHRMSLDEPLWFVEISAKSFRQMMDEVDNADPLLVTMKRIEEGFTKITV